MPPIPRTIRQPEGSELCGQACVAMAAGVSLDRACETVGHRKATRTKELITALSALGLRCAERLHRISQKRPSYPRRCILHVHKPGSRYGHWILLWDGVEYDPAGYTLQEYRGWKVLSYLEIYV